jgi:adenine/guanine phosphoribosyltransferase-like PRPP-binding protein
VDSVTAARPTRQSVSQYKGTAFDRTLLPDFTEWLVQEIARWQPDFIIPAETKGARLLDAAIAYARDVLGTPITVPVIYSSALSYMDPALLQGCRVTIVDDAVCTGSNLDLHRRWITSFGIAEIQALVCVGLSEDDLENTPTRRSVHCYVSVNREVYERCIWQLAELVIARGLPPEVDHFVFEARVPGGLASTWRELERVLPAYGELTIDGPSSKQDRLLPMTLHFPTLPGRPNRKPMAPHNDGPDKLRLFADPVHDRILALPISLPSLTLPPGAGGEAELDATWARRRIAEVLRGPDPVGDLLVGDAKRLHPKTAFRVLSSATEIELMRGFAEVLGEAVPGVSLSAHQEPFDRLYGPGSGERVFALVKREIHDALARGAEHAGSELRQAPAAEPRYLDNQVADTTRAIAEFLKAIYDDRDPTERLGLTMPKIAEELRIDDPLLLSRCVSFGLAMTTLVPYIEVRLAADGTHRVERFYRVSENNRGSEQPYTDIDRVQREKSEQALALVCHRIRTACFSFADGPIPEDLLTAVVGVLYPLVFERYGIALCVQPGSERLQLLLLDGIPTVLFEEAGQSAYYRVADGGVVPSDAFRHRYDAKRLDLDLDRSTEEIEEHVGELEVFLEHLDRQDLDRLMTCWAMSTDRRLGLGHVRKSLNAALDELRQPLKLILGGQTHDPSAGAGARARKFALGAACKLRQLNSDWSAPALDHWQRPARREERLLRSLGAPSSSGRLIYTLPIALATIVAALGEVVENLDVSSVRHWVDGEEVTASGEKSRREAIEAAVNWSAVVRQRLLSLEEEGEVPATSDRPVEAIREAAEALLDTINRIDAFVAACVGNFRGAKSERRPEDSFDEKRDVSILAADIGGSTSFGELNDSVTTLRWKEGALDLAGQWTRAFGSWPVGDRRGDEIRLEFDAADTAVLCAAVIQQHVKALRSTGGEDVSWKFHCGVDTGQVQDGFENVNGTCIDRASKLAKRCDENCETDHVFVTKETRRRCSPELRERPLASQQEGVLLSGADGAQAQTRPFAIDSAGAMRLWVERLQEAGEWIAQAPKGGGEGPLWFGPDLEQGESEEESG